MRKSKFTGEQIAYCLTQAEAGVPVSELCRKYGISLRVSKAQWNIITRISEKIV